MKTGPPSLILQYSLKLKLFRSIILFSIVGCSQLTYSQITSINGIVNTYYKVIDFVPAKACVRVTNAAGLNYSDKVMLIQMKGAGINTSNSSSSSFGDTTSLNNAGNYEIGTVCHVIGDSVFLVFMLLNQYTVADKVQLVKIPQYYSADVTDTLRAAPWNNTTGTGGVLAISVEEDLTLNAPIYADSSGFRGGAYQLSNGTCSNISPANAYAYNANVLTPQNGGFKGEGIADVAAGQSGGRGAPANGGGGGNNHNNGGAGGANLTPGGDGGGNSSSVGCVTSLPGKAGKAMSSYGGTKIFPGGGGGAGHVNNGIANAYGGGHGGGIIFIQTKNLIGNNKKISANGQTGGRSAGDGAAGGGAGGSLIINATNYSGILTIEAKGGQGGTEDNGVINGRCYGSGGGGSGGVIYFNGAVPPVSVLAAGGNAGPETRRSATCNPAIPALPGLAGQIVPDYTYSISLVLASTYCSYLLPVELVWFKARYTNGQTILTWKVAQPEMKDRFFIERSGDGISWIEMNEQPAKEGVSDYIHIDHSPQPKTNFYRLKMIDKNNAVTYSSVQKIFIPTKNDLIKIYPNPAHKKIIITGNISPHTGLSLFDLSGKLLWRKNIISNQNNMEIDLPDLSVGIYMIEIGGVVKKLVIR
ncbi:MAG: T9SS type A sorting domain-containing protein [Chitinophagaceae bacterium]